ncbi:hypothetical protein G7085_10040 [Tessaracoccus sp. HDW20]|uniref:hypothetical protein n=1 Tax=Tessaracoccus coleopterorum TaxID=2714950 RepID=UPI0018D4738D|nr:hypothetical protein [Tessaracoccus coleopterorum]NHB84821.1 hypothetical protein [Tessaracoccus coleopterorum]
MSSERESYGPNYLSPDYGTREDAPVEATPAPTSGPDFASAYDALEPAPSVYDEGYLTPTPAPIVDEGSRPAPAPVHAPYPQAGPPQGYGQQPYGSLPTATSPT